MRIKIEDDNWLKIEARHNKDRKIVLCVVSKIKVDGYTEICRPRDEGNFNFIIEDMQRKNQKRLDNINTFLDDNKDSLKDSYCNDPLSIINFVKNKCIK